MKSQELKSFKFVKIIIDRKNNQFKNLQFLPKIVDLYKKFSKYLSDDYFLNRDKNIIDAVMQLIESVGPYFWVVVDSESQKFAGIGFLENWVGSKNQAHSVEVTTCFHPEYWGKYTKICAKKFIKYCFKKYKLKKMKACIFPQNTRVRALLKQAGFKYEARLYAETLKDGKFQDIEVFSIIRK